MFRCEFQGFIKHFLLIALISCCLMEPGIGQESSDNTGQIVVSEDAIQSNSIREEIQRYFGYEDLLYRYLTIPYDMSQNVNQLGRHVDIGFPFLALWPILILILVYRRKKWFYGSQFLIIMYLMLSWSFSHLRMADYRIFPNNGEDWSNVFNGENSSFSIRTLGVLYDGSFQMTKPIRSGIDSLTGTQDHITYPLLIIFFCCGLLAIGQTRMLTKRIKIISIILSSFGFLWWILGGGIIWYGMLMLPLGYALIIRSYSRFKFQLPVELLSFSKNLIVLVLVAWACMAYVDRISYVDMTQLNAKNSGQDIANKILMFYSSGLISAEECREGSTKNVAKGMRRINSDDRYVYQVGTHLVFEIENNPQRVFEDNTLSFAWDEMTRLAHPSQIVQRLKDRGFGYILLDLNTPLLDRTPEKSLVNKYQVFLQQLYNNPRVELVATDREVFITNSQGEKVRTSAVVGGSRPEDYPVPGTYAIYEIL